jgi:type IV secretory pathway TrbD component
VLSEDDEVVHVHASLMRPVTYVGMERTLAIVVIGIVVLSGASAIVVGQRDGAAAFGFVVFGLAVATVVVPLVQWMTRADPHMRKVAIRHMAHQEYYPAWPHLTGAGHVARKRHASPP